MPAQAEAQSGIQKKEVGQIPPKEEVDKHLTAAKANCTVALSALKKMRAARAP